MKKLLQCCTLLLLFTKLIVVAKGEHNDNVSFNLGKSISNDNSIVSSRKIVHVSVSPSPSFSFLNNLFALCRT